MARPYSIVNRGGSACIGSTGVTVNTANVVFTFPNHAFAGAWYYGTVFINLRQEVPTGTTGTLPVIFETNGVQQAVTKRGGDPLTVADLDGVGIYEFFYEKPTNILQLL